MVICYKEYSSEIYLLCISDQYNREENSPMKKLFAILLAVAMVMSFTLVASAEETTETTPLKAAVQYLGTNPDPNTNTAYPQVGCFYTPSTEAYCTNYVTIDGNGTYTMSWDMINGFSSSGIIYLYIEFNVPYQTFVEAGYEVSNVKLSVDGNDIPLDQSKLSVWADSMETENKGSYCVELYVLLAATDKPMDAATAAAFTCSENITVSFDFTDPNAVVTPDTPPVTADVTNLIGLSVAMVLAGAAVVTMVAKKKEF